MLHQERPPCKERRQSPLERQVSQEACQALLDAGIIEHGDCSGGWGVSQRASSWLTRPVKGAGDACCVSRVRVTSHMHIPFDAQVRVLDSDARRKATSIPQTLPKSLEHNIASACKHIIHDLGLLLNGELALGCLRPRAKTYHGIKTSMTVMKT